MRTDEDFIVERLDRPMEPGERFMVFATNNYDGRYVSERSHIKAIRYAIIVGGAAGSILTYLACLIWW